MKLVCTPAPTVTGGNAASCAPSGAAAHTTAAQASSVVDGPRARYGGVCRARSVLSSRAGRRDPEAIEVSMNWCSIVFAYFAIDGHRLCTSWPRYAFVRSRLCVLGTDQSTPKTSRSARTVVENLAPGSENGDENV